MRWEASSAFRQQFDAFEHGGERRSLQAVAASDDRQWQADAPGPVRRKCRVGKRAPKRKRPDRKPYRLGGEGKLACFAHPYAEDRDLLGVMKACSCRLRDRNE
jgi:hypothetical protein